MKWPTRLRDSRFSKTAGTLVNTRENYDLVIVGGGISGLSAAYFYRQHNPSARVLILDNHDDFGGHAKRNEFRPNGGLLITNARQTKRSAAIRRKSAAMLYRDRDRELDRFQETGNPRGVVPVHVYVGPQSGGADEYWRLPSEDRSRESDPGAREPGTVPTRPFGAGAAAAGHAELLATPFSVFERHLRDQFARSVG
jgi:glycine/D-amino acid oxidase-like deaminating enzyme